MNSNSATLKYLDSYAEQESRQIQGFTISYDYIVVIPVCNESPNIVEDVCSHLTNKCLLVLVVNSPDNQRIWQQNNQIMIDYLCQNSVCENKISENIRHLVFDKSYDILLVDRNSTGLQVNPKQGVGLARKIGADIALKLYSQGLIKHPWIFSTDADVVLPENYFSCINSLKGNYSAVVLDFKHLSDNPRLAKLQFLYDFKMRYYLAGVKYGQVGYAYIPLGSTLIASMESYAHVRGFPKRNAGEDFYLLNKLAKIKPIKYIVDKCVVQIHSRFSDRVPFGTGPAIKKIDNLDNINEYTYYNPQCFIYIKLWKEFLENLWSNNSLFIQEPTDKLLIQLYDYLDCQSVFTKSKRQITSLRRWQQFIHQWFDAFKILKSVHFFDKKFERLNYKRLLKDGSFVKVTSLKITK